MSSPAAPPSPPSPVPSVEQVCRALRQLEPLDAVRVAMHLLTPRAVMLGPHVTFDTGWVRWRDEASYVGDGPWEALVERCRALAVRCQSPGDEFLDLSAAPATWLKLVRSGAFVHLAGARELFAAQSVTFDLSVSPVAARTVASLVVQGVPLRSGELHVDGVALAVRADERAAHVAPA